MAEKRFFSTIWTKLKLTTIHDMVSSLFSKIRTKQLQHKEKVQQNISNFAKQQVKNQKILEQLTENSQYKILAYEIIYPNGKITKHFY